MRPLWSCSRNKEKFRETHQAITIYSIAVPSRGSGISEFPVSVYLYVCPLGAHEEVAFESRIGNDTYESRPQRTRRPEVNLNAICGGEIT